MHEDTQYNVVAGAEEPTKEEHPAAKERTGYLCNDSSKKSYFCRGAKGIIYMQYMR